VPPSSSPARGRPEQTAAIGDHALLSDCRTAALVTRDGVVDRWPSPRFDSPSAFSALLDPSAGHWSVQPAGPFTREGWRYVPETLVAETTLRSATGSLRPTDALAFAPGARGHEIGRVAPHALVRRAEALDGAVEVEMTCRPRLEYGLAVPEFEPCAGGAATRGGPERLHLAADRPLEARGGEARARFTLRAGERAGWTLQRAPGGFGEAPPALDPHAALDDAVAAWRSWAAEHRGYDGLHAGAVHLATLVLQGLTYQPTGAVVAAATTSLPEIPGGDATGTTATAGCATPP
jgi:GH15 family glucan-1,4-alpha-glucosidase